MLKTIKNIFTKKEERASNTPVVNGVRMLLAGYSSAQLSEEQILEEVHSNPAFWACISLIATSIADTEIYAERHGVLDDASIALQRLENPNSLQSGFTFRWVLSAYLLTLGTAYIVLLPDKQLIPVGPHLVRLKSNGLYTAQVGNYTLDNLEEGVDLIRLALPDLRNPYAKGVGYGSALSFELDISNAAAKHEAGFLKNHARPDLIINYKSVNSDQLRQLQEGWMKSFQGSDKSGKTTITNAEDVSVTPLSSSFKDLGFVELRKYSDAVIRQTFGIPPELLGIVENSNRATIEAAEYIYQKNVVQPRVRLILGELTTKLLPLLNERPGVVLKAVNNTPEDREFVLNTMKEFPQAFTINEARRLAGFSAVENGSVTLNGGLPLKEEEKPVRATQATLAMRALGSMREELYFNNRLLLELNTKEVENEKAN